MRANEIISEKWTQKYKSSINCSHPKGFSQKAHCAGKSKHNEDITMEMVCEDCGMCQTHGSLNEIAKGAKDSNGVTKCWPGKHAEGTKKGRNGGQVRNCVPNESQGVAEGLKSMYHNAVAKHHGRKADDAFDDGDEEGFKKSMDKNISHKLKAGEKIPQVRDPKKFQQGVAEGSLNEFAPDGFNGGNDGEEFNPRLAKMAYDEGVVKGVSLADGATLERAMAINDWDKHDGGIYKQHFAKGFKAGRMNKIRHGNKQYNLNLKLMKDGSVRDGEQGVAEAAKHGLYYNVNKRKAAGTSRPASSPKAPTAQAWKDAAKTAKTESVTENLDELNRILDLSGLALTADQQFDIIESMVESWALYHGVDSETIWEDFESVDDAELLDESAAWHRSAGKSKKGGLNRKGVASYRAEHPGSHLQMAVTTKPSKLKPGSKAAKRRKSFCARMGGNKGPMKKPNGDPTRKALALRKWHCE
jgi:hypothetical protein